MFAIKVPAEPLSREDALSKRLQTLRNRREGTTDPENRPHPPPPYTEAAGGSPSQEQPAQPRPASSVAPPKEKTGPAAADHGDTEYLRSDEEDRTLDEILDGIDVEDDEWYLSETDDEGDSKGVEELLAKLKDDPGAQPPKTPEGKAEDRTEKHDDDDSEGEEMSREVGNVLSRAMDELNLDGATKPADQAPAVGFEADNGSSAVETNQTPKDGPDNDDDDDVALPEVPRDIHDNAGAPTSLPRTPDEDGEAGLTLPTVPTKLVDPAPPQTSTGDPFETSIQSRLAALKETPPVQTDAFGLPSAPTFQPEDRPIPGVAKKPGYTDEDQKTWCIVCLEDGTVRCLGCDGDVYCARCWREMHVGPSAGYDERGHKWEKFDRRQI
ncbi:Abscission/NoCut checkpoint regulator [Cytospora mali]|uniref:Abscission/NoCut checkpoint regulator n=1 Tax=Cytospora mali TaxID=578113 RepID=A0A194VCI0_CYTMA|nr:Abscission/NoCut checkpoint regulator [Valsa mali var. pyri (nom. inval.)]